MTSTSLLNDLVEAYVYGDPSSMQGIIASADSSTRKKAAELAQVRLYAGSLTADEEEALQKAIALLETPTGASALPKSSVTVNSRPSSNTKLYLLGGAALVAAWFLFIRKK